ncbi:hypothetical protein EJ08DRAFT_664932 [Tothia fuscella]|uniref:Uncharacterized protein n=1 Tax=Tothia fuscella TaxID=1048955 RepID=A0A9P4NHY5_9PEZI|nr:hypothetical protein EJ08DRAFT_664932 [Tothia fuscella]
MADRPRRSPYYLRTGFIGRLLRFPIRSSFWDNFESSLSDSDTTTSVNTTTYPLASPRLLPDRTIDIPSSPFRIIDLPREVRGAIWARAMRSTSLNGVKQVFEVELKSFAAEELLLREERERRLEKVEQHELLVVEHQIHVNDIDARKRKVQQLEEQLAKTEARLSRKRNSDEDDGDGNDADTETSANSNGSRKRSKRQQKEISEEQKELLDSEYTRLTSEIDDLASRLGSVDHSLRRLAELKPWIIDTDKALKYPEKMQIIGNLLAVSKQVNEEAKTALMTENNWITTKPCHGDHQGQQTFTRPEADALNMATNLRIYVKDLRHLLPISLILTNRGNLRRLRLTFCEVKRLNDDQSPHSRDRAHFFSNPLFRKRLVPLRNVRAKNVTIDRLNVQGGNWGNWIRFTPEQGEIVQDTIRIMESNTPKQGRNFRPRASKPMSIRQQERLTLDGKYIELNSDGRYTWPSPRRL